ncbi:MAG: hypothetical protein JWO38_573 [Gemmataceae bacterium]|nr:hypothetical protein [Gemmataceae bacterium]
MDEQSAHWRGRRVLVTGCTGFLGSAVVRELLTRGTEVVGLVRDRTAAGEFFRHQLAGRVHVVHGRTEDVFRIHSALAVYEARAVFHLAADPSQPDRGTAAVIESVRRYDPRIPVVVARPTGAGLDPNPPTPFPQKDGGEDRAVPCSPLRPGEEPGEGIPVPLGVARFGEVFGGDRKTSRPVPAAVVAALTGDRPTTQADGPARDRVFVRDAARACVLLAEALLDRPAPQITDATFRSGWALTDREMTAAVRDVVAGRVPQLPSADPPANPLGWAPVVSFPDALGETIDWYRQLVRTRVFATPPADPARRAA